MNKQSEWTKSTEEWKKWWMNDNTQTTKQWFKNNDSNRWQMRDDQCDPRLHNVIKRDPNCTDEINGYIGGYEWGRNSKWNGTKCVHLYCAQWKQVNKERSEEIIEWKWKWIQKCRNWKKMKTKWI